MTKYPFQTSYKKSIGKNFLIIEPDDSDTDITSISRSFRTRMLHENNIPGLLNTHVQYIDDAPSFQYDITGMQSLEIILETTPLTYPVLCRIFISLYNAFLSLENYMLLHDHVLLLPDYIYLTADFSDIRLCYCPLKKDSMGEAICDLFDYLLKKVEHSDEKCVYLAYSMHRCCHDSDFNLSMLYTQLSTVPSSEYNCNYNHNYNHNYNDTASATATPQYTSVPRREAVTPPFPAESEDHSYTDVFLKRDNNTAATKFTVLSIAVIIALLAATALYFCDLFNLEFYIILLIAIIITGIYNAYNIHRQYGKTELEVVASANNKSIFEHKKTDTGTDTAIDTVNSTVLLTASDDTNSHRLIYTGTGDECDITLTHFPFVVGKTESCSAILRNSAISRLHAKLSLISQSDEYDTDNSENIFIEDLNSTNGTLLNNTLLTPYEKYPITSGDYITFGHLTYIFR